MTPGEVIRARRHELGVTLADLAKATGYSASQINAVELGKRRLTAELAEDIDEAFSRTLVCQHENAITLKTMPIVQCPDCKAVGVKREDGTVEWAV